MSRIRILGASLIATALGTSAALAADIYAPAPAPEASYAPAAAYDWTGVFAGGLLGYGWGQANGSGADRDANGVTGGAYAGYDWQVSPSFVVGGEADITASGMEGKGNGLKVNNPWNSTFRAKAGFTMDRFMLYGTGGLSVGEVEVKKTSGGSSASEAKAGWTIGAGGEALITNSVTGRLEYRYTDYGTDNYKGNNVDFHSNQVFAGVGLKF
jgi:outer membrane immunogenic protein